MENKKNILFVLNYMGNGGVARSLINLLFYLEKYKDDYNVDLMLLYKRGELLKDIPSYVNVIEANKSMKPFGISQKDSKTLGKKFYLKRAIMAIWSKFFSNQPILKHCAKKCKTNKVYDLSIAFAHTVNSHSMSAGCPELLLYGIKSKKKVVLCHCDVSVPSQHLNKKVLKNYITFDKFYAVSQSCCNKIKEIYPQLNNNIDYLYNTQLNDEIIKKSTEFDIEYPKTINIVSVSRLSQEKAHLRSLKVFKRLHDEGYDFCWHIVGDGELRSEIENFITNNNMSDYVKCYGGKLNPYPYVKSSDLFYLGSYHESFGLVLIESMLLNVPALTTKTISSQEIVPENFGWICENDDESIYNELKFIFDNQNEIKKKKANLKNYIYDNDSIVKKLLSLIK